MDTYQLYRHSTLTITFLNSKINCEYDIYNRIKCQLFLNDNSKKEFITIYSCTYIPVHKQYNKKRN